MEHGNCGPMYVFGCSRENPARAFRGFDFHFLAVLILISASEATRYCLSSPAKRRGAGLRRHRRLAPPLPGPPLVICVSRLCACCRDCSRSYGTETSSQRLRPSLLLSSRTVRTGDNHALCLGDGVAQVVRRGSRVPSVFMERSSFACRAANKGERLPAHRAAQRSPAGPSQGTGLRACPARKRCALRDYGSMCSRKPHYYLTRPRNIQCTPARRGTQTARSMHFDRVKNKGGCSCRYCFTFLDTFAGESVA